MSQDILLLTAVIAVILMGSAMCSGIEAALLAVNPLRVHELARRNPKVLGARRLEKLRHRIGRTLTVVTIANNSFNIFGSLMVGSYATYIFQDRIGNVKPIFFVGLTILVLLLGEIVPKALGTRLALQISLTSAPVLDFLSIVMRPLLIVLERLLPIITAKSELTTDEEEIRQMARLGSQKGQIEADEAAMIGKVFQLNDLTDCKETLPGSVGAATRGVIKSLVVRSFSWKTLDIIAASSASI